MLFRSVAQFLLAAQTGDPKSQTIVSVFYADGRELSKNYAEAYKWAHLAAVHGDPKGGLILDILVQKITGDHIFEGRKNAAALAIDEIEIILKAAEAGNDRAQIHMGTCYELGCGVAQNYTQAVHWYQKAANQGNSDAQTFLGLCYASGCGIQKDQSEAALWYQKAADQGHSSAAILFNSCLAGDKAGVIDYSDDFTDDVKWYRKAAEHGDATAQGRATFFL